MQFPVESLFSEFLPPQSQCLEGVYKIGFLCKLETFHVTSEKNTF